jgi:O-antigen/teichoic acid export membrane protein
MNAIQYVVMALFYVVVAKTNALTPADLGVLSVLFFISSTLTLSTLALPTALTKFASEYMGKNQSQKAASVQRTLTRAVVVLSLAGLVVATILSAPLSQYFWGTTENVSLIILISVSAFLMNLITLYRSGLRALQLFGKMAQVTLIYILTSRIIAALMALLGFGVSGVTIGYIIGSLAGLIAAIAFVHDKFASPDNQTPIKPLLQFSLPLFLSSLALLIISQADVIILASVTSNYALVGIYSVAVRSLLALSVIWQPILVTIFPVISARFGLQNAQGVSNALKIASRYLSYTIIPSCVLLATVAPTALNVFYGPNYVSGAAALAILAISVILSALLSLLTTTLTAIGETNQVLEINLISALVTVTLLMGLVSTFDVVGAAITRLAVRALSLLLAAYMLGKHVNVQLDREALWKSAVASIIAMPFLLVLESAMTKSFPVVQVLAAEILAAGVVYLASLYALKALKGRDFELLRQAFPKIFAKYIDILEAIIVR